jgi:hypothetical protein
MTALDMRLLQLACQRRENTSDGRSRPGVVHRAWRMRGGGEIVPCECTVTRGNNESETDGERNGETMNKR